ncbi:hypothetical protein JNA64_01305 [Pseudomonas stutzeri]|uniref:hypothetical protein n=1 Tax=Stutzerimonas stutzeri TaxID=316 RepID=UPI001F51E751|nr:hypothetical protein [Stutzerimonas stutzeri]MCI0915796.1 hypothetical protein [Stutzerimonas stutzeri]
MTNRQLSSFVASCGLVLLLAACASWQRVTSQRNSLTTQADQAQAWFRLYCSLGGGWNADPSLADQLAAQP